MNMFIDIPEVYFITFLTFPNFQIKQQKKILNFESFIVNRSLKKKS